MRVIQLRPTVIVVAFESVGEVVQEIGQLGKSLHVLAVVSYGDLRPHSFFDGHFSESGSRWCEFVDQLHGSDMDVCLVDHAEETIHRLIAKIRHRDVVREDPGANHVVFHAVPQTSVKCRELSLVRDFHPWQVLVDDKVEKPSEGLGVAAWQLQRPSRCFHEVAIECFLEVVGAGAQQCFGDGECAMVAFERDDDDLIEGVCAANRGQWFALAIDEV